MDGPSTRPGRTRWGRRAWAATSTAVALAVLALVLPLAGVLLVLGDVVVPAWCAAASLLVASALGRAVLRARRVPEPDRSDRGRRVLAVATTGAWVAVPLSAVLHLVGGPTYTVVEPAGSDGCRAVVEERAVLFAGSGSVHVAGGWGPFAPEVGSYVTDDGDSPVADGSYGVRWSGQRGGLLTVGGVLPRQGDESGSFAFEC